MVVGDERNEHIFSHVYQLGCEAIHKNRQMRSILVYVVVANEPKGVVDGRINFNGDNQTVVKLNKFYFLA